MTTSFVLPLTHAVHSKSSAENVRQAVYTELAEELYLADPSESFRANARADVEFGLYFCSGRPKGCKRNGPVEYIL